MRKTGQNDPTTCLEEGEAVRFAHLEQQKAIDRSGCEEQYFRFGRCLQMASGVGSFAVISKKSSKTACATRESSTFTTLRKTLLGPPFGLETASPTTV